MFAYRRQQPSEHAALLCRWLIAYWASTGGDVCIADWDESNAYCNIPRCDLPALLDDTCPTLAPWLQRFYDAFQVYVVTPHGLTTPYRMAHGGGQGDSAGVGSYLAVNIQRTHFHQGVLRLGAQPRDLLPGAPPADALCYTAPHDPSTLIPEVCYSDDRRLFGRSDAALAHLLDITCHGCWKAGAAVNPTKLQTFKLRLQHGRLTYLPGNVPCQVNPLQHRRGGLALAGVPLVMGASVAPLLQPTLKKLRLIHSGILRLQPTYILALRIVLSFALARLDYLFGAVPPRLPALQPLQRATDAVLGRSGTDGGVHQQQQPGGLMWGWCTSAVSRRIPQRGRGRPQ